MTRSCIPLTAEARPDLAELGGKAAGLIELARAGLPVVSAYCIPSSYYQQHVTRSSQALRKVLEQGDEATPEDLQTLRVAIRDAPLSEELAAELESTLAKLGDGGWAVRSSSAQEDGSRTSFAGLHDSILNIRSLEECMDAVKQCWASLWSERAHAYRARHDLCHEQSTMAVVIQDLVNARASGVAFSMDPVSRNPKHITIEAVSGLGELLVSGRVQPDLFKVRREDLTIDEAHLESRSESLVADEQGGTSIEHQDGGPAIDEDMVRTIARNVARLVDGLGAERDTEWAVGGEDLVFVQSRPVTTPPLSEDERLEGQVWSNLNSGEVMPDVVTPMSWSLLQAVERVLKKIAKIGGVDLSDQPLVGRIGGRIYFNLSTVIGAIRRVPFTRNIDLHRTMGGHSVDGRDAFDIPDEHLPDVKVNLLSIAMAMPGALVWAARCRPSQAAKKLDELVAMRKRPEWAQYRDRPDRELVDMVSDTYSDMFSDPTLLGIPMFGMSYFDALEQVCKRWFPHDAGLLGRLLVGQGGVESAESGLDLLRLARFVDRSSLRDRFLEVERFENLREALPRGVEAEEWWTLWHEFLDLHGHHTRGEIELGNPRWSETPDELFSMLKGYVHSFDERDLLREYEERSRESERCVEDVARQLWFPKRQVFRYLVRNARRGASARENIKSEIIRHVALARRVLLELGERAVARGVFRSRDDIFFLDLGELQDLPAARTGTFTSRVEERRNEYDWNCQRTPPPVIFGFDGPSSTQSDGTDGILTGLAVSQGVARGRARVVLRSEGEPALAAGEILVAPFTDPGWTPLMIPAAAIVTDMGGQLSHGSIVARELGVPAVANVGRGTTDLRTGDWIEVDGTRGTVRRVGGIRTATIEDAATVCSVVRDSITEVCGPDYGNNPAALDQWLRNKTVETVRGWIAGENLSYVAESEDGSIVGFGHMSPQGRVLLCYVAPEALGQGHGHRLLDQMERQAREQGLREMTLDSTITALRFYEAHGWEKTGEAFCRGQVACTPMRKRI